MNELISGIAIWALPVVLAITLHEAAHGYVARYFGDPTAYEAGRITLNPIKHVDLIGTIAVPLMLYMTTAGGLLFGWAKPVPVDFGRLRNPKADMLWVAAAGPFSNLLMAVIWAALLKLVFILPGNAFSRPMAEMAAAGIQINAVLMLLNLIPIPPLDGGRIAVSLLPMRLAVLYSRIEPFGMIIIVLLLVSKVLGQILTPLIEYFITLLSMIFGFHA